MAGGRVFDASLKALAPFGRLVTYGIASREQNEVAPGALMRRSHAVVGFWLMHCLRDPAMVAGPLEELFARAAAGELRVVEGEAYPLSEVRRAHEDLQARRTSGQAGARPRALTLSFRGSRPIFRGDALPTIAAEAPRRPPGPPYAVARAVAGAVAGAHALEEVLEIAAEETRAILGVSLAVDQPLGGRGRAAAHADQRRRSRRRARSAGPPTRPTRWPTSRSPTRDPRPWPSRILGSLGDLARATRPSARC